MSRMKLVILTGNPADGFAVIGPFDHHDAAVDYMEYLGDEDSWLLPLNKPEEKKQ